MRSDSPHNLPSPTTKNVIIYGDEERPKLSFKQSPSGSMSFQIENKRRINFNPSGTLTWSTMCSQISHVVSYDCIWSKSYREKYLDSDEVEQKTRQLIDDIANLCGNSHEQKFFSQYVAACQEDLEDFWALPALIPQAWVNWSHYDPTDQDRARRVRTEAFRVDFLVKDDEIGPNFIVFEIDGPSHFVNFVSDDMPRAMDAYTTHIRKDRWLRKQGWEVFRITTQEIDECENFPDFYFELTGRSINRCPF